MVLPASASNAQLANHIIKGKKPKPTTQTLKLAGCYSLFVRKASVCNQQYKSKAIVK